MCTRNVPAITSRIKSVKEISLSTMKGARMYRIQNRKWDESMSVPFLKELFNRWDDIVTKARWEEEDRQKELTKRARKVAHAMFNQHKQPFIWTEHWLGANLWPYPDCYKKRNLIAEIAWHLDRCDQGCKEKFSKECFKKHHFGWEN